MGSHLPREGGLGWVWRRIPSPWLEIGRLIMPSFPKVGVFPDAAWWWPRMISLRSWGNDAKPHQETCGANSTEAMPCHAAVCEELNHKLWSQWPNLETGHPAQYVSKNSLLHIQSGWKMEHSIPSTMGISWSTLCHHAFAVGIKPNIGWCTYHLHALVSVYDTWGPTKGSPFTRSIYLSVYLWVCQSINLVCIYLCIVVSTYLYFFVDLSV